MKTQEEQNQLMLKQKKLTAMFVSVEIARILRKMGFDELCFVVYNTTDQMIWNNLIDNSSLSKTWCACPTFEQAFLFLHEKGIIPDNYSVIRSDLQNYLTSLK